MKVREDCTPQGRRYDQPRVFLVTGVKDDVSLGRRGAPHLKVLRRASGSQSFRSPSRYWLRIPARPGYFPRPVQPLPPLDKVYHMPHLVLGCRAVAAVMAAHTSSSSSSSDPSGPPDRIG
ncbi:hypothetical protein GWK47_007994 [Chionoecetes opilio]|uniref:Uncharacterized protein n=1 Tax=Chionoecetes opilio TaxID=41210 RepID=A0A8J4YA25_CHIOP|nr:hypothetical protein GWK47_007994 [Chionoecetes opilio]